MKIDINHIPFEGLFLEEDIVPAVWDLETDIVKFAGPIKIKAEVFRITNAVTAYLKLNGLMRMRCSRCLNEFETNFQKALKLNYTANKLESMLDLGQDVREEILLTYPIKSLCSFDCKGLCPKCGKNLNTEKCNCSIV